MRERAFWIVGPGRGEIRERAATRPKAGELAVQAVLSGISRGTESLVFRGMVPESEYGRMRCPFQEGAFPAPLKYGYSSVGRNAATGERVFCLYPHQDRYNVPAEAALAIPDTVSDERAALAANMETAVNALWDEPPRVGDRIAVVGGGVVGCLIAALAAQVPGTSVSLVDRNPDRASTACRLAVAFAVPEAAPADCDIVYHASGSPAGLSLALSLAAFEARVVDLSWYGTATVPLPLGEAFHARRLRIVSSQVGSVAAPRRARRTRRDRLALALGLLGDPAYDVLLTGESRFEDLPETMVRLADAPGNALCHLVRYA